MVFPVLGLPAALIRTQLSSAAHAMTHVSGTSEDASEIPAFLVHSNAVLIDAIAGAEQRHTGTASIEGGMRVNAVAIEEMISDRIIRLCKDVERLACELDLLTARGHSRTVYAVLMRMRLAAMTAELVTADLVERLQQAPFDAKAASEDARTPR